MDFVKSVQSRTAAEEDVAVAVDRDGFFMESFFRRVGIKFTVTRCEHAGVWGLMPEADNWCSWLN